ncbi:hypothetical protein GCM10011611_34950 [Aliidongia dinghuensis]|uniref:Uncharacterized protein n=1 Tax=Aliidongia dinghuensis TaxID=1867774 RepID=A0A8J3E2Z7_9PROT|nr:hypothetical protein GCM10011611_34950 [Aliidongia dinghuensis]
MPGALLATKQQLVFCYSSDLLDAAQFLAKELNTLYCRCIYNGTGDLPDQIDPTAVAWLVAHGSSNNTLIGTKQKKSYDMGTLVLPWCAQVGIKTAVDTCCEPSARKALAQRSFSSISYYCRQDDNDVIAITGYTDVGVWWTANNMGGP